MPQVQPPPVRPIKTDIELFAKAYFNIELTSYQMEIIAMVSTGKWNSCAKTELKVTPMSMPGHVGCTRLSTKINAVVITPIAKAQRFAAGNA